MASSSSPPPRSLHCAFDDLLRSSGAFKHETGTEAYCAAVESNGGPPPSRALVLACEMQLAAWALGPASCLRVRGEAQTAPPTPAPAAPRLRTHGALTTPPSRTPRCSHAATPSFSPSPSPSPVAVHMGDLNAAVIGAVKPLLKVVAPEVPVVQAAAAATPRGQVAVRARPDMPISAI